MEKKNKCCWYALSAVLVALLVIGSFWGYGLGDWSLLSWLGALAIIIAVLVCAICKRADKQE